MILGLLATLGWALGLVLLVFSWAEESPRQTRKAIQVSVYIVDALHALTLVDGISWWRVLVSLAINHVYTLNLQTFPLVNLASPGFLGSCILAIANHFMWFFYFIGHLGFPFGQVCAFMFFCVWMVPISLFISLMPVESSLPNTQDSKKTRQNMFKAVFQRLRPANGLIDCAEPGVKNIYDGLLHGLKVRPDTNAMGKRDVVKHKVNGEMTSVTKKWSYFKLSDYKWMTYRQIADYTKTLGSGFLQLGLKSASRVVVYAPTSREWQLCALSTFSQSMQIVTAYDTLGEEGVLHAMNESEADLIFLKADQMPILARIMDRVETVKHEAIEKAKAKFEVKSLEDVYQLGADNLAELNLADPDEIAMVMYTSGSTGKPKGVLISHANVMSVAGGIHQFIPPYLEYGKDVILSYLPLSHVLAFFVDMYCLYSGLGIGYGTPRTLTDDSVRECLGDIKALRPMVMLGVPQVWNTIRAGMLKQVDRSSSLIRKLFYGSVGLKNKLRDHHLPHNFLDDIVFKKTREATGGRLKFVITGGAPINKNVQRLMTAALCPMIQGYGMTEMSGLVSVQLPSDTTLGNVGPPSPSVECKLVDVPEAKYFAKNNQGEVWLRGPSVFKGYLHNDKETKETITEDGWVKTGDIGEWTERGELTIIDRKKNLVKLVTGEYIALEALEATYKNSLFVNNICVYADSHMGQPCALVNIDGNLIAQMADDNNIPYQNPSELATSKQFIAAVLSDLQSVAKHNHLAKQETLAAVSIDAELWTPENGMLTAASKLKRTDIVRHNQENIDAMVAKLTVD
ncbi:long-chain-fatty-acid-CoA ligase 1 [Linderina pennispora]|uniref:Long-chain-fatty-acid-CoA ligase 1 n=1 Tax=Linderina pennispora TaxID=61395 RepID=A0A1Y1VXB4_9FUNG|nr:long-chain-fatty-acid-CoA ligase 1 [Linderina pennispora]ORX65939.1 long-chain-fatty-acid-CoA ligase 1 [Linderina pennispora]